MYLLPDSILLKTYNVIPAIAYSVWRDLVAFGDFEPARGGQALDLLLPKQALYQAKLRPVT